MIINTNYRFMTLRKDKKVMTVGEMINMLNKFDKNSVVTITDWYNTYCYCGEYSFEEFDWDPDFWLTVDIGIGWLDDAIEDERWLHWMDYTDIGIDDKDSIEKCFSCWKPVVTNKQTTAYDGYQCSCWYSHFEKAK